jgi:hypothetical protein
MVTGHESASRSKYIDAVDLMEDAHARIIGVVSTDLGTQRPVRRRKALDLAANTTGNRDLLAGEPLRLVPELPDTTHVAGKWRRPVETAPDAPLPQPVAQPVRESNFVFSPTNDTNGNGNGHKSAGANGSAGSGSTSTTGNE